MLDDVGELGADRLAAEGHGRLLLVPLLDRLLERPVLVLQGEKDESSLDREEKLSLHPMTVAPNVKTETPATVRGN